MRKKAVQSLDKEESKLRNVTQEKLVDLPFSSAKLLKEAQDEVRLQVWRRLEEAKVIHQMLKKENYKFWTEEFTKGLTCSYEAASSNRLVRVFSNEEGIHICINRGIADNAPASEAILKTLVKAMSESFSATYYRAKGIVHPSEKGNVDKEP